MLNAGQDKRISIYQTYSLFVPLFSKPKIILYFIIYETLKSFQRRRFPFWGEIKPLTPILLTVHFLAREQALLFVLAQTGELASRLSIFQLHWKPLYLVIYSRLLDLTSRSHWRFATWG